MRNIFDSVDVTAIFVNSSKFSAPVITLDSSNKARLLSRPEKIWCLNEQCHAIWQLIES